MQPWFTWFVIDIWHYCGRQKEPAILISTLLLQTHTPQLYSLVLTRFCWNLESSTTNTWNAKNAIFSRASRVTFGPWITWRSLNFYSMNVKVFPQTTIKLYMLYCGETRGGGEHSATGRKKAGRWNGQSALGPMCDGEKDWHHKSPTECNFWLSCTLL